MISATKQEYNYEGLWTAKIDVIGEYVETADETPYPGQNYYILSGSDYVLFTGNEFESGTTYYVNKFYSDEIMSLTINQSQGDNRPAIGALNSAYMDFQIYTADRDFQNKKVTVSFKANDIFDYTTTADETPTPGRVYYYLDADEYVEFDGSEFETGVTYYTLERINSPWRLVGTFFCEKPTFSSGIVHITAYDALKYISDDTYTHTDNGVANWTWWGFVQDVCSQVGVPFATGSTPPDYYSEISSVTFPAGKLDGLTYKKALQSLAAFVGRCVVCEVDGTIVFRNWLIVSDMFDIGYYDAEHYNRNEWVGEYQIEEVNNCYLGVKGSNGTAEFLFPTSDVPDNKYLPFNCSLLNSTEDCNRVYLMCGAAIGDSRGCTLSLLNGSPCFQAGDIFYYYNEAEPINSFALPISQNMITYDGKVRNNFSIAYDTFEEDINTETINEKFDNYAEKDHTHMAFNNNVTVSGNFQVGSVSDGCIYQQYIANKTIVAGCISDDDSESTSITLVPEGLAISKHKNGSTQTFGITNVVDWTELPLNTSGGVTAYSAGGYTKPMYRRIGDRVDVIGAVNVTTAGTTAIRLGTIPNVTLASTHYYFSPTQAMAGNKEYMARLSIGTNGNVNLGWVAAISDGAIESGVSRWVEINTSFFILDSSNVNE